MSMTFATSTNPSFYLGTVALVKSIRHFHPDAQIVVMAWELMQGFESVMHDHKVELVSVDDNEKYCPRRHGKAMVTDYAINELGASKVLHIDSDAWLLNPVDRLFDRLEENTVIGFVDPKGCNINAKKYPRFFDVEAPDNQMDYKFNAGIVGYGNGEHVKSMAKEFLKCCLEEECNDACGNQGTIRALAAKYHMAGKISFEKDLDYQHWNPIWGNADEMELIDGSWVNSRTGKRQMIFHATGGKHRRIGREKPWQEPDRWSQDVMKAWEWVNAL